jgi:radical SAM superfamily enzyme YgiQ (UPF0313 family)
MLKLCRRIKELDMEWMSQCSLNIADDTELLSAAKESGCFALSFGIESISQDSLDSIDKKWARVDRYDEQIRKIEKAGIDVSTEMVIGADGDTLHSIERTADFIIANNIPVPRFYILTPIPGTVFYKEMLDAGRIVNRDIYSYDGSQCVHKPANMTSDELTKAYWDLYDTVFSFRGILKRTILRSDFFANPQRHLFYFYINLYYRYLIKRRATPNII